MQAEERGDLPPPQDDPDEDEEPEEEDLTDEDIEALVKAEQERVSQLTKDNA